MGTQDSGFGGVTRIRRSGIRGQRSTWIPLRCIQATALAGLSNPLFAQQTPADGPSVLPLILTLIFVVALIPVAVWLLKRLGNAVPASTAGLRIVAQLPLGPRERLVIVEAGQRWLVLGVTAGSINRVATLPKGELPDLNQPMPFATLLGRMREKP